MRYLKKGLAKDAQVYQNDNKGLEQSEAKLHIVINLLSENKLHNKCGSSNIRIGEFYYELQ